MGNIDKSRKKPEQAVRQALRITASSNPMRDAMALLAYINESNVVVRHTVARGLEPLLNYLLLALAIPCLIITISSNCGILSSSVLRIAILSIRHVPLIDGSGHLAARSVVVVVVT